MELIKDTPKMTGMVNFKHYNGAGDLIGDHTVENLVVNTGLAFMAARLADSGAPSQMSHMALGASSQSPAAGDSALISQLGSRVSLTTAGGTPSGTTITYTASFGAGDATGAVVEAGVFNASTSGTMLCRTTFPLINKGSSDSLIVTWVVTVS